MSLSACKNHATLAGWRVAVGAFASMALVSLIAIAGLPVSAGPRASSGPGLGDKPTNGLRGAEVGATLSAARGPGEH